MSLSLCFQTATRSELVDLAHDIAKAIPHERLCASAKPYIICLTGDPDAGKSLFWDEIKKALFGSEGKLDKNYSEDLQTKDRIYEAWDGHHTLTGAPLRVFFCNMDSLFLAIEDDRKVKLKIFGQSPKIKEEMGDLLILSNIHLKECDLHIDLKFGGKNHHNNWFRRCELNLYDPAIKTPGSAPLLGR